MSILDFIKIAMHEFKIAMYDYINLKYREKAKLCYIDVDNFIICIKTKDNCEDINGSVNKRFDISNCKIEGSLTRDKRLE